MKKTGLFNTRKTITKLSAKPFLRLIISIISYLLVFGTIYLVNRGINLLTSGVAASIIPSFLLLLVAIALLKASIDFIIYQFSILFIAFKEFKNRNNIVLNIILVILFFCFIGFIVFNIMRII